MLRNRKTGVSFTSEETFIKTTSSQSLFSIKPDVSNFNEFINEIIYSLPVNTSTNTKQKIIHNLRNVFSQSNNESIATIAANPEKFNKLINEVNNQIKNQDTKSDSTSIYEFAKILGQTLVTTKLNTVFPGLVFLANMVTPAAALSNKYLYFLDIPEGGDDLCANALGECIQGYLTRLDKMWTKDLPQIARTFEGAGNESTACVSHVDIKEMLERAYRGPSAYAEDCTIQNMLKDNSTVKIFATNMDPITCDMMQDSVVGQSIKCSEPPVDPRDAIKGLGLVVGISALAVLTLVLYTCHKRKQPEHIQTNEATRLV